MTGHQEAGGKELSNVQKSSCAFLQPVDCIVALAGGDQKHPEEHQPLHTTPEVPDSLLHLIPEFANLSDERDCICEKCYTCQNRKERDALRLFTAQGSLDAEIFEIKASFQMLAA